MLESSVRVSFKGWILFLSRANKERLGLDCIYRAFVKESAKFFRFFRQVVTNLAKIPVAWAWPSILIALNISFSVLISFVKFVVSMAEQETDGDAEFEMSPVIFSTSFSLVCALRSHWVRKWFSSSIIRVPRTMLHHKHILSSLCVLLCRPSTISNLCALILILVVFER